MGSACTAPTTSNAQQSTRCHAMSLRGLLRLVWVRRTSEMASTARATLGARVTQQRQGTAALRATAVRPAALSRRSLRVHAAKTADGPRVAIAGVTGAVGQEFLEVMTPPT